MAKSDDKLDVVVVDTVVGKMQIIGSTKGLCAMEYVRPERQQLLDARLKRWFKFDRLGSDENEYVVAAIAWLRSYFDGDFKSPSAIPLDLRGTPFELRVWQELRNLALGEIITYSDMAERIGNPKAPRAVGGASRRNPMSIIVPCHRVIGASGKLTGYGGGLEHKGFLIDHESKIQRKVAKNIGDNTATMA